MQSEQKPAQVEAVEVSKVYGQGLGAVHALRNVSMTVRQGEFVAIMGASGSGKSTLLHCLAGLDQPTSGDVLLNGKSIANMGIREQTAIRRHVFSFVFQTYQLIPTLSARENIILPLSISHTAMDFPYFEKIVSKLGISDAIDRKPSELSGGQQQRVACARALITKPAIIFADEPTGSLDSKSSKDLLDSLKQAVTDFGQAVVMVTHSPFAASYADTVLVMCDGCISNQIKNPTAQQLVQALEITSQLAS